MHLRTVRARLLLVTVAGLTGVMAFDHYYMLFPWLTWWEWEPCMGATDGFCGTFYRNKPFTSVTEWAFLLLVVVILSRPVARWVLAPVRNLVPLVAQVGPQNLGLRIPSGRDRKGEVAALTSALNAMLDRLAAAYEGQRNFAANASHELRTPLALQRMLIEIGMTEPLTEDRSAQVAGQLLQANERSERLIEGLLTLSQAEQGLVAHTPQRLDEIVAEVVQAHQPTGVTLTTGLRPRVVSGDRILLERLARNLVENALKYNVPGGTVHVEIDPAGALVVTNTGPAVPAAEIGRLFEPFTRLAGDRLDHSGGSGLGLAIVRAIVRTHGGTVDAAPNAEGGGLQMTVTFPA
ncbi:HAMP domain-containing protein [Actinoplanes sp. LDG1-06]|uniref:histidine kinase n=1 Tax=Paractinoplanes ovalisporus TaxID=2810368 RepID=A0ABS2AFG0_9ACTN|nr:ATP-binding protein [Actinoplanes ovalisporus]MBM2618557.1 HAMP domain-containing protein [Actinoplanes ovalisporus]